MNDPHIPPRPITPADLSTHGTGLSDYSQGAMDAAFFAEYMPPPTVRDLHDWQSRRSPVPVQSEYRKGFAAGLAQALAG